MALILTPVTVVVATLVVFRAHDYPVGDVRYEPPFWGAVAIGTLAFGVAVVAGAIRALRRPRP